MTEAAVQAHRNGIVTACSVVANGKEFQHAVDVLAGTPSLDVGVHLTLVEEAPLAAMESVRSLVNRSGSFHRNYRAFALRYWSGAIDFDQVERELRLQIERVVSAGLTIRHLNGPQHLHLLPKLLEITLRLAQELRVPFVRSIVEKQRRERGLARAAAIGVLSRYGRQAQPRIVAAGLRTSDRSIGVAEAGHLSVTSLLSLLD